MKTIKKHTKQLQALCEEYKVKNLYVFGSAANDTLNKNSDIDFMVEFGDINIADYFDNYSNFKKALEDLFNRKIDLLEKQTLKNPVLKKSIDQQKILIYERKDSQVAV